MRNSLSVQVTALIRHGHEVDAFYLLLGIGIGRLLMVGFHEVCVLFVMLRRLHSPVSDLLVHSFCYYFFFFYSKWMCHASVGVLTCVLIHRAQL